jgi:hypothetical protein
VDFDQERLPGAAGRAWAESIQSQAWEAFARDLDELLRTHPGRWVAYRGPELLGIGDRDSDLYVECLRRGFTAEELFVERVEPAALEDYEVFLPPAVEFPEDQPS